MSAIGLRPLGVGEILDASIKLYTRNARTLILLTAVIVVPMTVITAVVLLSTLSSGNDVPTGFNGFSSQPATDPAAQLGADAVLFVFGVLASTLATAACVRAVSDLYGGRPTDVATSLKFAAARLVPLTVMYLLMWIGLTLGFIALIVPGIWLYAAWSVAAPALLIDRVGPIRALGRSRRLVKGRWWATAGVLLVSAIMVALISGAFQAGLVALALTSSNPSVLLAVVVVSVARGVGAILVQPFSAVVTTVLYYDLRIRKEGYDLQRAAEQLGLPEADLSPGAPMAPQPGWGQAGPESVGQPGGPPYWPPPPGWVPPPPQW